MRKSFIAIIILLLFPPSLLSQEITETNTDKIYFRALEEYKAGNYETALLLTQRGLELAPEYHDIRILHIRNLWAIENYAEAEKNLNFLLANAPGYVDVKPLLHQRLGRFPDAVQSLAFLEKLQKIYPEDMGLQVKTAYYLFQNGQPKEARELATFLLSKKGISGADRYSLQLILNRTVTNEIGLNYQYINFSEDYSRNKSWNSISGEFQHNFGPTAVIGRATYADRGYDQGKLFELEAYPVFNERLYAFANVGFSGDEFFPDFRSSASIFYNFAEIFEAEAGARVLLYDNTSFFTGVFGLTAYTGKFYLNARSFLGPERNDQLVQNYQLNVRFYFLNVDNYLFLRLGSGISPDETVLNQQVQVNPTLDAWYGNFGINKTMGTHHIFQIGAGFLSEDITRNRQGLQFIGTVGYRYRF